jgi:hypothetical protein
LPAAQQDGIITELSAKLHPQMEDREAELGRPLSEAEQEAILQQHGHPMLVAGRYQGSQGSLVIGHILIGATLFPLYRKMLWRTMAISLSVCLVIFIALGITGTAVTFSGFLSAVLLQIVIQSAVVTAIFAVVDQYLPTMQWNAHHPPALHPMLRQGQLKLQLESIVEIVAILVCLYWLWVVFEKPTLLVGSAAQTYQLGPIWRGAEWLPP